MTHIHGIDGSNRIEDLRNRLINLLQDKLEPETGIDLPLVIIISGGTNVGKSSLMNWILGEEVSAVSNLARGTKTPVICGCKHDLNQLTKEWCKAGIEIIAASDLSTSLQENDQFKVVTKETSGFPPDGCLIVDSPDFDSTHLGNQIWSNKLLFACDALILTVTPEKYNDEVVINFLGSATQMQRSVIAVFNKNENDEAFIDFKQSLPLKSGLEIPVLRIPRLYKEHIPPPAIIHDIKNDIVKWSACRVEIKRHSLDGTLHEFRRTGKELSERLQEERKWMETFHQLLDEALDEVISWYRKELKKEKFVEVDVIFRRLLKEYRVKFLDDAYEAIQKGTTFLWRSLRTVLPGKRRSTKTASEIYSDRDRDRVKVAIEKLYTNLLRLPANIQPIIKSLVDEWVTEWNNKFIDPDGKLLSTRIDEEVDKWIDRETTKISDRIREHPNLHRFLITGKAALQIGFGILGAYLMGGFTPSDVVIGPVLERFAASMVELGLGKTYFIKRQVELLDLRCRMVRSFLEDNMVTGIRKNMPWRQPDQADRFLRMMQNLPSAEEMIK